MSRIECETAAQCQQMAEATQQVIEPAITVSLVAIVLVVGATIVYREAIRR